MSREKNEVIEELEAPIQDLSAEETADLRGGATPHVKIFSGADVTSEADSTEGSIRHRSFAIVDRTN